MTAKRADIFVPNAWPRMLSREQAALWVGLSTEEFMRKVERGAYPPPVRGIYRTCDPELWDLHALPQPPADELADPLLIYFIQAGDAGPIKIGISNNPEARLKALQTAHYEELTFRLVIEGQTDHEARLHRKFRKLRMRGEWFRPHPVLLAFIDRLGADRYERNNHRAILDALRWAPRVPICRRKA